MSVLPVDVDIAAADIDDIGKTAAGRVDIENQNCTRSQLTPDGGRNFKSGSHSLIPNFDLSIWIRLGET